MRKFEMRLADTRMKENVIIKCYNDKYLKMNGGDLTGSYLGGYQSSLKPYCGVFRKYVVVYHGIPEMCYTITYSTRGSEFLLTVSPNKALEFQPAVEAAEITRHPENFIRCFFKRHQLQQDGLLVEKLESLLYSDVHLYYNDDTNKAEFRSQRTRGGDLKSQLFNLYRCPSNTRSQPIKMEIICTTEWELGTFACDISTIQAKFKFA